MASRPTAVYNDLLCLSRSAVLQFRYFITIRQVFVDHRVVSLGQIIGLASAKATGMVWYSRV